jgi:hypothetical protein
MLVSFLNYILVTEVKERAYPEIAWNLDLEM